MSLRGFAERGRPPLFTMARDKDCSVSSGSSLYSCGRIAWASTLARSDFKVRRESDLLTIVGLSHAEYMARCASGGVANHDKATRQTPVTNDAGLTIVLAGVLDFESDSPEHNRCVFEVESASASVFARLAGSKESVLVIGAHSNRRTQCPSDSSTAGLTTGCSLTDEANRRAAPMVTRTQPRTGPSG